MSGADAAVQHASNRHLLSDVPVVCCGASSLSCLLQTHRTMAASPSCDLPRTHDGSRVVGSSLWAPVTLSKLVYWRCKPVHSFSSNMLRSINKSSVPDLCLNIHYDVAVATTSAEAGGGGWKS
jgi:hypothetical protein